MIKENILNIFEATESRKRISRLLLLLCVLYGCLEPYDPPAITDDIDILVVDGFINAADGSARVILSHASALSNDSVGAPEVNATVTISDNSGGDYQLLEFTPGVYVTTGIPIDYSHEYQLFISTANQATYFSDPITLTETPPIDSLTWRGTPDGIEIYVNTHDGTGQSKYYRWDYIETWKYHSTHQAAFKVVDHQAVVRGPDEIFFYCWKTVPSTNVLIGSSTHLAEDVIRNFPIIFIPHGSQKYRIKYSVEVQQRTMGEEEFIFWKDIQRVTEGLGGLFDSQPYQVTGNIYQAENSLAPVLGYFAGGTIQQQRLFIDYYDLPSHLQKLPRHSCNLDTICIFKSPAVNRGCINDLPNLNGDVYLVSSLLDGPTVWGYLMATPQCANCTLEGGTLDKPSFWID
jgi:hypothetical protein